MFLVKLYRDNVPLKLKRIFQLGNRYGKFKEFVYIATIQIEHKKALRRLKKKDKINCVFFALFDSVWKYDNVYRLMADHPRFEPIILVCPIVNYGKDNMILRMNEAYEFYKQRGYNVIKSYDEGNDTYIDVKKELKPDIIFYTNPYETLIDKRYFITNFRNVLTVYVPYSINNSSAFEANYNLILYNLLWRHYLPTNYHLDYSILVLNLLLMVIHIVAWTGN